MKYDNNYLKTKLLDAKIDNPDFCELFLAKTEEDLKRVLDITSEIRLKIGESLKTDNVVFVLGNGCSIYAGSKSASLDLRIDKTKYQSVMDDLLELPEGDFEFKLNALTALRDYYRLTSKADKITDINSLISDTKTDLLSNYVCCLDYSKLNLHETFLLKLRSFGILNKTSIFTPNYDLAFEYTFDKIKEEYSSGFTGFITRRFNISSFSNNNPNVVKIHGSLNWKYDDSSKEINEFQPLFANNYISPTSVGDAIIYPTSEKVFQTYNTPYSELLRFMLDVLQGKRNVVFILGYKYKDEHINDVLIKSLKNPFNLYYFFDYDEDEKNSFLQLIKEIERSVDNVNILSGKCLADFSTFVKYLLPSNPEKSDEEKIFELLRKVIK